MANESEHTGPDREWIKRIKWSTSESPFGNAAEAIVSIVIEGNLSPEEAKLELLKEQEISDQMFQKIVDGELAERMPPSIFQTEDEIKQYFDDIRYDIAIAVRFVEELSLRNLRGMSSRQRLLNEIIAQEKNGREPS